MRVQPLISSTPISVTLDGSSLLNESLGNELRKEFRAKWDGRADPEVRSELRELAHWLKRVKLSDLSEFELAQFHVACKLAWS